MVSDPKKTWTTKPFVVIDDNDLRPMLDPMTGSVLLFPDREIAEEWMRTYGDPELALRPVRCERISNSVVRELRRAMAKR